MNARTVAQKIWATGHAAICPHLNTLMMDDPCIPDSTFYEGDEEMIRRCCDAMVMLPGWEYSKGSIAERKLALCMGMPVFYYDTIENLWAYLEGDDDAAH